MNGRFSEERILAAVVGVVLLFVCGCSENYSKANKHINAARNILEVVTAKSDLSSKESLSLYQQACNHYYQAYTIDKEAFIFPFIRGAFYACGMAEDAENQKIFQKYSEEYLKQFPDAARQTISMPRITTRGKRSIR
jgi:hypothetical protein